MYLQNIHPLNNQQNLSHTDQFFLVQQFLFTTIFLDQHFFGQEIFWTNLFLYKFIESYIFDTNFFLL